MSAQESLRDGRLTDALVELQAAVRDEPTRLEHRTFLFQLLCVLGRWDKALDQLNVLRELDDAMLPMAGAYQEAIQCEALRSGVFDDTRSPLIFGEPEQWLALLVQSLHAAAQGNRSAAEELRGQALEQAPATTGVIDGDPFEWIADADSRLGPVLEAIVNGRYYWVPLHRVKQIDIEPPEDLRDVVWMPAHFVWTNGGDVVGLIPTRYPGSEKSDDPQIPLSRKTVWSDLGGGVFHGLGQRMLATDAGEYPLMDVRKIVLNTGDES